LIATDPVFIESDLGILCQFDSNVIFLMPGFFDTLCEMKDGDSLISSVLGVIPSEIGIIQG